MNLGIIGVGFVGGATAEVLKEKHNLYLYDKYKTPYNSEKNLEDLAANSECVFICVPTPMQPSGAIDYSNIHNSISSLLGKIKLFERNPEDLIIIIRSTAVSGTTDKFAEKYPSKFVFNPEFLREKHALEDMKNTTRVVIGTNDPETKKKVVDIYRPIFPNAEYILTSRKDAEMIKYAANVFLASSITLANEIFNICKAVGADYETVKKAILLDPRIPRNIDVPGPDGKFGFGGKCFPKDLAALIYLARENMYDPHLLAEIFRSNKEFRSEEDWYNTTGATSQNNFDGNKK